MAITLGNRISWSSANSDEEGYRVYRSGYDFDESNLPEVLVELPPGSNHYVDTTADMAADHYYMVSVFHGSQEIFTDVTLKVPASLEPQEIGQVFQGGFYAGNIELDSSYGVDEGVWAIIVAGPDAEITAQWKTARTDTPNTNDKRSGWANTQSMTVAGLSDHPAAEHCINWQGGGFDDWYLGAEDEWAVIHSNRSAGGLWAAAGLPASGYIWSSTQNSANSARYMVASSGSWSSNNKTNEYAVRPIRRIKLAV